MSPIHNWHSYLTSDALLRYICLLRSSDIWADLSTSLYIHNWTRFLSFARSKLRLCSAYHRPSVTCPVIGRAQTEPTPSKSQKTGQQWTQWCLLTVVPQTVWPKKKHKYKPTTNDVWYASNCDLSKMNLVQVTDWPVFIALCTNACMMIMFLRRLGICRYVIDYPNYHSVWGFQIFIIWSPWIRWDHMCINLQLVLIFSHFCAVFLDVICEIQMRFIYGCGLQTMNELS